MSKAARIKRLRAEGKDRSHTLVTREANPRKMNNPANAAKARMLNKAKAKNPIAKAIAAIR
jgi:hypothetical protein